MNQLNSEGVSVDTTKMRKVVAEAVAGISFSIKQQAWNWAVEKAEANKNSLFRRFKSQDSFDPMTFYENEKERVLMLLLRDGEEKYLYQQTKELMALTEHTTANKVLVTSYLLSYIDKYRRIYYQLKPNWENCL